MVRASDVAVADVEDDQRVNFGCQGRRRRSELQHSVLASRHSLSLSELETGLAREIESVARVFGKRDETENTVQDIGHWTVSISIMIGLRVCKYGSILAQIRRPLRPL